METLLIHGWFGGKPPIFGNIHIYIYTSMTPMWPKPHRRRFPILRPPAVAIKTTGPPDVLWFAPSQSCEKTRCSSTWLSCDQLLYKAKTYCWWKKSGPGCIKPVVNHGRISSINSMEAKKMHATLITQWVTASDLNMTIQNSWWFSMFSSRLIQYKQMTMAGRKTCRNKDGHVINLTQPYNPGGVMFPKPKATIFSSIFLSSNLFDSDSQPIQI